MTSSYGNFVCTHRYNVRFDCGETVTTEKEEGEADEPISETVEASHFDVDALFAGLLDR